MVDVAQSVRASDCGSEGRGFEPLLPPPFFLKGLFSETFFVVGTSLIAYNTASVDLSVQRL